ncbi:hypothetical protein CC78DRAFT_604221 [Lojkania enalia]|uniref:Uncharacterized protein n=1 Tax=Lojkania enalia TaxID=147567 RepID=A0A9P4NA93_9PLEO|nr:hypothetical protein CC78DRAFT_604221 [Didymosphaeria enalia]
MPNSLQSPAEALHRRATSLSQDLKHLLAVLDPLRAKPFSELPGSHLDYLLQEFQYCRNAMQAVKREIGELKELVRGILGGKIKQAKDVEGRDAGLKVGGLGMGGVGGGRSLMGHFMDERQLVDGRAGFGRGLRAFGDEVDRRLGRECERKAGARRMREFEGRVWGVDGVWYRD